MKTERFRKRIFIPFAVAMAILLCAFVAIFHRSQLVNMERDLSDKIGVMEDDFRSHQEYEIWQLEATMKAVRLNNEIKAAFMARDRELLLKLAEPLYKRLNSDYEITHFYFTGPDRMNLLRVHSPGRYGDRIDRTTTLDAERTKKAAWGTELGPLGTFTLRVVLPWYEGKRLIGYLELGKELDHILDHLINELQEGPGVNFYSFLHK